MLNILRNTMKPLNTPNTKCAEVFYQSLGNFTIICTQCDMKTFEFQDFLLHFENVHVLNNQVLEKTHFEDNRKDQALEFIQNEEHLMLDETEMPPMSRSSSPLLKTEDDSKGCEEFLEESVLEDRHVSDYDYGSDSTEENKEELQKNNKKPFKCLLCPKSYCREVKLQLHIDRAHHAEPTHKCDKCEAIFTLKSALNSHKRTKHTMHKCDKCDKVYTSKEALSRHQYRHVGGEKQFACETCGKKLLSPYTLQVHMNNVHRDERNWVCETCGWTSKKKAALIVHKRKHTGEKPFKCKICDKAFASSSLLIEHKPIHSNERPHVCDVCGAAFSRQKALYHHKHLHLPTKKYVCKLCGKAYAQAAGLAGHMRQHRSEAGVSLT